jgi:hypothetical protein
MRSADGGCVESHFNGALPVFDVGGTPELRAIPSCG